MNNPAGEALITADYLQMQQKLHENPDYGTASVYYAPLVAEVLNMVGADELLDYGAGKGRLGTTLKEHLKRPLVVHHYDPAIPKWAAAPKPCKFVACIDVLEGQAVKVLPDGRNAHLIQKPPAWWLPKIIERFELITYNRLPPVDFWVAVEPRKI